MESAEKEKGKPKSKDKFGLRIRARKTCHGCQKERLVELVFLEFKGLTINKTQCLSLSTAGLNGTVACALFEKRFAILHIYIYTTVS